MIFLIAMTLSCKMLLKKPKTEIDLTVIERERLEQAESKCEEGKEKLEEGKYREAKMKKRLDCFDLLTASQGTMLHNANGIIVLSHNHQMQDQLELVPIGI